MKSTPLFMKGPINRGYMVCVPNVNLTLLVIATIAEDNVSFQVYLDGLPKRWRAYATSPEGARAINDAAIAHHRQVEMEAWAKLTKETSK